MKLSRGERFKDSRVIYNKNGKQTQAEVYSATGIPASCITDLEDDDKQRNVGYDTIAKLARHYGVSADFLLGLSESKSFDPDIQSVCQYTGLSDHAIQNLKALSSNNREMLNSFLGSARGIMLIQDIFRFCSTPDIDKKVCITDSGELLTHTILDTGLLELDGFSKEEVSRIAGSVEQNEERIFNFEREIDTAKIVLQVIRTDIQNGLESLRKEWQNSNPASDYEIGSQRIIRKDTEGNNGEYKEN